MSHVVACFSFPALASGGSGSHELLCLSSLEDPVHICPQSSSGAFLFLINIFHEPDLFFLNLYAFPVCQVEYLEDVLCIIRGGIN